ncbi:MAG: hypothetical protein PHT07_21650 [Paludibacter sp.]|nr:hypothetical protein [Paludibacter sp.]
MKTALKRLLLVVMLPGMIIAFLYAIIHFIITGRNFIKTYFAWINKVSDSAGSDIHIEF